MSSFPHCRVCANTAASAPQSLSTGGRILQKQQANLPKVGACLQAIHRGCGFQPQFTGWNPVLHQTIARKRAPTLGQTCSPARLAEQLVRVLQRGLCRAIAKHTREFLDAELPAAFDSTNGNLGALAGLVLFDHEVR